MKLGIRVLVILPPISSEPQNQTAFDCRGILTSTIFFISLKVIGVSLLRCQRSELEN